MTMPLYKLPMPDRKAWTQLRDKAKVPKGVAKPSIGDDLDAVYRTFGFNTMSAHEKATKKLQADLKVYVDALTKKGGTCAAFKPTVEKELVKKVDRHVAWVADVLDAKSQFYPRYAAVLKAEADLKKGGNDAQALKKACEKLLGCLAAFALLEAKWNAPRQALNRTMADIEKAPTVTAGHFKVLDKILAEIKPG